MLKLAIIIEVAPHLAAQAMAAAQQALAPFGSGGAPSVASPQTPMAPMQQAAPAAPVAYPSNPHPGFVPPQGAPAMPPAPPQAQPAAPVPGQVTAQDLYAPMQKYAQQHRADGVAKVFDAIGVPSRSLANCTPEQLALAKQWFESMQLPA